MTVTAKDLLPDVRSGLDGIGRALNLRHGKVTSVSTEAVLLLEAAERAASVALTLLQKEAST